MLYTSPGCGMDGGERILVKVTLGGDSVAWSGFDHQLALRPVEHNISPGLKFIFDRRQYEDALSKKYTVKNEVYFDLC